MKKLFIIILLLISSVVYSQVTERCSGYYWKFQIVAGTDNYVVGNESTAWFRIGGMVGDTINVNWGDGTDTTVALKGNVTTTPTQFCLFYKT